jgi:hypothetical protein
MKDSNIVLTWGGGAIQKKNISLYIDVIGEVFPYLAVTTGFLCPIKEWRVFHVFLSTETAISSFFLFTALVKKIYKKYRKKLMIKYYFKISMA